MLGSSFHGLYAWVSDQRSGKIIHDCDFDVRVFFCDIYFSTHSAINNAQTCLYELKYSFTNQWINSSERDERIALAIFFHSTNV